MQRRCKHDLKVVLEQRIGYARNNPREVFDVDQRHGDADQRRAPPGERSRAAIAAETQLAHGLKHSLASARCNVWTTVEHT